MDQNSTPNNSPPAQSSSPEEDTTLLAIEALEARTVDPDPRPLNAPREIPVPERHIPTPTVTPKVIEPIIAKPAPSAPQPVTAAQTPIEVKPTPIIVNPAPKVVNLPPAPIVPPKPKKPATPSEEMAEELASAPSLSGFQFFANQKAPRKPFIIVGIAVVIIGAGVAAYFATR
ncbi:MAG TPA: hypothetical protein VIM31_01415 [Candidatus Microsaccharimonas sp.]|jgi:hypothetical protein